jgi:hypothetical protein
MSSVWALNGTLFCFFFFFAIQQFAHRTRFVYRVQCHCDETIFFSSTSFLHKSDSVRFITALPIHLITPSYRFQLSHLFSSFAVCLWFHTNANDLRSIQKMYLFSFKLLLLVYSCSCTSAGGRLSHNFFLTSALDEMTPNYKWFPHLDAVMHRRKEAAVCSKSETLGLNFSVFVICKVGQPVSLGILHCLYSIHMQLIAQYLKQLSYS